MIKPSAAALALLLAAGCDAAEPLLPPRGIAGLKAFLAGPGKPFIRRSGETYIECPVYWLGVPHQHLSPRLVVWASKWMMDTNFAWRTYALDGPGSPLCGILEQPENRLLLAHELDTIETAAQAGDRYMAGPGAEEPFSPDYWIDMESGEIRPARTDDK